MVYLRDMVVILPGITGSVLQKDGIDFWGASKQSLWNFVKTAGFSLDALKVKDDDPNAENLDDGVKAVRLVEDATIIPGLFKVDGYTKTTEMITKNFDKVMQGNIYNDPEDKPANLYHFPYDWRRDNRASAKILQKLLNKRLKTWREYSQNPSAKVILLAHSMGGLVSRYYLEVLGGWQDCKALFTFGTPYRGSLDAVNFLANGYKEAFIDLTEAMRTMNSVYQLMPRYKALKINSNYYRIAEPPEGVELPNIDLDRAKDALKFHNEIDDAADANYKNDAYRKAFVTCPIVGVLQPTQQSAKLVNNVISTSTNLPEWLQDRSYLEDGDGTVPQVSAIPVQMGDLEVLSIADYIPETHGAIQSQPDVLLNLLKSIQSTQQAPISDIRGSLEQVTRGKRSGLKGIGLSVDDLYLINEPITMQAKVSEGVSFDTLTAEIWCISGESSKITANFHMEDKKGTLTTNILPVGLYHVKVKTDNKSDDTPNSVHDIFLVTDLKE